MGFGELLQEWRERANIKQAELERQIGKSRGYLARVESGAIAPSRETCLAIAAALRAAGLDVSDDQAWSAVEPSCCPHPLAIRSARR